MAIMKSTKKQTKKQLTEKEVDSIVESQADDDSAWETPIKVHIVKPASLSISAELGHVDKVSHNLQT